MNNKIKDYRKLKNITQEEMANKLNVSRQSYINYENGETEPSFETLKKISKILSVSIDALLGNDDFVKIDNDKSESILNELRSILSKYGK